jgi:hypothetical protein
LEDGFMALTNDMHMGWSVVVWVDDNPERANPQNSWQAEIIARNLSA